MHVPPSDLLHRALQALRRNVSLDRQGSSVVYRDPPSERLQGSGAARYAPGQCWRPRAQAACPVPCINPGQRSGSGALRWLLCPSYAPHVSSSRRPPLLWICLKRRGGVRGTRFPYPRLVILPTSHGTYVLLTYMKYILRATATPVATVPTSLATHRGPDGLDAPRVYTATHVLKEGTS